MGERGVKGMWGLKIWKNIFVTSLIDTDKTENSFKLFSPKRGIFTEKLNTLASSIVFKGQCHEKNYGVFQTRCCFRAGFKNSVRKALEINTERMPIGMRIVEQNPAARQLARAYKNLVPQQACLSLANPLVWSDSLFFYWLLRYVDSDSLSFHWLVNTAVKFLVKLYFYFFRGCKENPNQYLSISRIFCRSILAVYK